MAAPITLATAAGNGNTTGVACQGRLSVAVYGTHGGGTTLLQISPDDGVTWITVTGVSITADTVVSVDVPTGGQLRLNIAGGAGNSVNAKAGTLQQF